MPRERETLEVDVLFVGAGPANLSAALHLKSLIDAETQRHAESRVDSISIAIIEKGREIGAHTLSGAILDPIALHELLPKYHELSPPPLVPVTQEEVCYLTAQKKYSFPIIPPPLKNHGNFIISLNRLVKWLGQLAESRGIDVFCGFAGSELLFENDRIIGVRTGDRGVDKEGRPKAEYEPGVDILAKAVVLGEGVRGSLTKQLVNRLRLDAGKQPQVYAIGLKEVWELSAQSEDSGRVIHTLGHPLRQDEYGGGFVYNSGSLLSLGLVVGLDYHNPYLDPHNEFQRFKTHPFISPLLKGARLAHYGAKAIPEGGYYSMPRSYFDGGLIIGDAAGLLNSQRLKGIHLAMKSGMLAAETLFSALLRGDFSADSLKEYEDRLRASWVGQELYKVRNFRQGFEHGLLPGMLNAALQFVTAGRGWKDPLPQRPGHERMQRIEKYDGLQASQQQVKEDGITTFNKLTNVYFSGVKHEEDQPTHLLIADPRICTDRCTQEFANPCQRFCPANVYEMVENEDGSGERLQLNPSNCVHCKTCDIMDPYQVITWVPPEGGGGPNYVNL